MSSVENHTAFDDLSIRLSRRTFLIGSLALSPVGLSNLLNSPSPADVAGLARIREAGELLKLDRTTASTTGFDAAMEQDGKLAWKFFEAWNASSRTVIPGTAYLNDGKLEGYPLITMWDVGSLILAFSSARLLGIISQIELNLKAQQIVKLLKIQTVSYKGAHLPKVEISATNFLSHRSGFDAADVGRLLVALKILDNLTLGKFAIAALISGWNFATVMNDGSVCGLKNGRLEICADTSYAHYAKRGYELWGYKLKSVSGFVDGSLNTQDQLSLISEIVRRGRIATEPNATEAIELGESEALGLALDLLFAAQIKRYQKEGKLTCASEGILDQEPWFTYQSCQFDLAGDDKWVIDTTNSASLKIARKMGEALRTISTKGCFLWNAIRPGNYSAKLLDCARNRSRTKAIGFASNIYESDLRPTNCSDINANALILESLAYVKHGRRPLLQITEEFRAASGLSGSDSQ
jgi:Protein of unknown function (DUF3131)